MESHNEDEEVLELAAINFIGGNFLVAVDLQIGDYEHSMIVAIGNLRVGFGSDEVVGEVSEDGGRVLGLIFSVLATGSTVPHKARNLFDVIDQHHDLRLIGRPHWRLQRTRCRWCSC